MKILLADDHPLVRDALVRAVRSLGPDTEACEATDLESMRRSLQAGDFDLAVVDLNMPGMQGLEGLRALRRDFPTLPVVVVTAQDDATTICEVLACGVSGFIPKTEPCELILQALRLVLTGGVYVPRQALGGSEAPAHSMQRVRKPHLTPRQRSVLGRLLHGRSNKLIARELALTEGTVKSHVAAILRELGARSRTEAVIRAHALGLGSEPVWGRE
jgi:DNA-binding NarL/FixJ family response regulator